MTEALVVLLGVVWFAGAAYWVAARRGVEDHAKAWLAGCGVRILSLRRVKPGMFNTVALLRVSPIQCMVEAVVLGDVGVRRWTLRVGHPWLGTLRPEITVIEDDPWEDPRRTRA